jgi:hypothetical protein
MAKFITTGILIILGAFFLSRVALSDSSIRAAAENVMQTETESIETEKIP